MFIILSFFLLFQIKCENCKIKAAIFDLDGTLIDTQKLYDEIDQMVINKYGNGKYYSPEYKMITHGTSQVFVNRFLIEQYQINITVEELKEIKENYLKEKFKNNKSKEGAMELTDNLKNKYRFKIAIATSSYKNAVDYKLSFHKKWIDSDFDIIITGDDKRIKSGKPSPDIFILTANSLGVKPEECIIFENSLYGVKAAIKAGVGIVVFIPENINTKYKVENLEFNRYKTELIILNSLKDFDYSILN